MSESIVCRSIVVEQMAGSLAAFGIQYTSNIWLSGRMRAALVQGPLSRMVSNGMYDIASIFTPHIFIQCASLETVGDAVLSDMGLMFAM